jgi:hypothetical protein
MAYPLKTRPTKTIATSPPSDSLSSSFQVQSDSTLLVVNG